MSISSLGFSVSNEDLKITLNQNDPGSIYDGGDSISLNVMPEKTVSFVDASYSWPLSILGATSNVHNSYNYYGVVLESMEVGEAAPKIKKLDVPYRDGDVDITEFFGDVKFENRTITMNFLIPWHLSDQRNIYSKIATDLNGVRKKLVLAYDDNWYYEGRLTVGSLKVNNGFFSFSITMDAKPYKMQDQLIKMTGASSYNIGIANDGRMVSTISLKAVSGSVTANSMSLTNTAYETITYNQSFTIGAAIQNFPDFIITPGANTFKLTLASTKNINLYYTKGKI